MRGTKMSASEAAETINRLQHELYHARQAIIDLMDGETRELLMMLYRCRTREAASAWGDEMVKTLVERATEFEIDLPPLGTIYIETLKISHLDEIEKNLGCWPSQQ